MSHVNPIKPKILNFCPRVYNILRDIWLSIILYNAGEYPRHDLWQIKELLDNCKAVFPSAGYAIGSVVGFSQQGFVLTSIDKVNKYRFTTINTCAWT